MAHEVKPEPGAPGRGILSRAVQTLRSLRFAIILMGVIALACIVGTLVKQEPITDVNMAMERYGRVLGLLIVLLGLHRMYTACWFLALLLLFSLSASLCAFWRKRFSLRMAGSLAAHGSILLIVAGVIVRAAVGVEGKVSIPEGHVAEAFETAKASGVLLVRTGADEETRRIPVTVGKVVSLAPGGVSIEVVRSVLHFANVEGEVISLSNRARNPAVQVRISGETGHGAHWLLATASHFQAHGSGDKKLELRYVWEREKIPLGFRLRLDDFRIEYHDNAADVLLARVPPEEEPRRIPVKVGEVVPLKPDGTSVEILRHVPHFMKDGERVYSASDKPVNPAIEIRLTSPEGGESKHWLFARFPDFHGSAASPGGVEVRYELRPPTVKSFESHVTVLDDQGEALENRVIRVNSPLKIGRYTLYQSGYDPETQKVSILEVTYDPGVWLVFAGFILLPAGVAFTFYVKPLLSRKGRRNA